MPKRKKDTEGSSDTNWQQFALNASEQELFEKLFTETGSVSKRVFWSKLLEFYAMFRQYSPNDYIIVAPEEAVKQIDGTHVVTSDMAPILAKLGFLL